MTVRRRPAAIVASGCAALVLGVALSFSATRADKPSTLPVASTQAVPVVAAAVKSGDVPIYLHGIGTVDAWNTVVVRSQIQGPLIRIAFKEGQIVHRGDLLAEIDPRPYQVALEIAPRLTLWPPNAAPSNPARAVQFLTISAIESVSIGLGPRPIRTR